MKTLLLLLLPFGAFCQCPVGGSSRAHAHEDSLKNRSDTGIVKFISLSDLMNDSNRYSENTYVRTAGYIRKVKYGGAETCNCHSVDKDDQDYHIELVPDSGYHGLPLIAEINRYVRPVTFEQLKTLVGKVVTIEGWIFIDESHWQNAVNSNPKGTDLWRETDIEIHPVIKIQ